MDFPSRFGRYELIDLIATGGMAEVFRARLAGQDASTAKLIALKRVLPGLSKDDEFIRLFEKEIGLAFGLQHPNLVAIYDFGAVKHQYYLAMEYVHGKSLNLVAALCAESKIALPLEFSCFVMREVLQALNYAHTLKDTVSGKFVGIIHRDVSPHNVLLSYSGQAKLFDFGVAKISEQEKSSAGVIKGKPAYLSPEQARGDEVDSRTDLFSAGIVLWELLTGQRLFFADRALVAIKLVQEKEIVPPSAINPAVPPELDRIVMQALQRDIYQRYQTALDLSSDLDKVLAQLHPGYGAADVAAFLRKALGSKIEEENAELLARLQSSVRHSGPLPPLPTEPSVVRSITVAPASEPAPTPSFRVPRLNFGNVVAGICLFTLGMATEFWRSGGFDEWLNPAPVHLNVPLSSRSIGLKPKPLERVPAAAAPIPEPEKKPHEKKPRP